jgi:hypothetical protein
MEWVMVWVRMARRVRRVALTNAVRTRTWTKDLVIEAVTTSEGESEEQTPRHRLH